MKNDFIPKLHTGSENFFLMTVITVNFLIKAITASLIDLGNDEVYYWTYALFPDWSHFDHPPMVGLVIQLFSLNLLFHSELFIRMGSLILSSFSILLLFQLVKKVYSVRAACIAVLLFTASLYFNVISGLFILPDTPLVFFALLALYYGVPAVTQTDPTRRDQQHLLYFGFFTGMALLSKYSAAYLWFGFLLYIVTQRRIWLRKFSLYAGLLISFVTMLPVLYWNVVNHFISFSFHSSRVGGNQHSSFLDFNLGEVFYQNPVLIVVYILVLLLLFKRGQKNWSPVNTLLIWLTLPLIFLSTFFSFFMNVLPHWSGPAFIGLIMLSGQELSLLTDQNRARIRGLILGANLFFLLVLILVLLQIDFGLLYTSPREEQVNKRGEHDPSLDMFGWKQAEVKFHQFLHQEGIPDREFKNVKILSNKWFPAAHLDFYIAQPLQIELLVTGKLWDAHKYYWINQKRSISTEDKLYYITSSQDFYDPKELSIKFGTILPRDTIRIIRNHKIVKDLFIYEMKNPATDLSLFRAKSNVSVLKQ